MSDQLSIPLPEHEPFMKPARVAEAFRWGLNSVYGHINDGTLESVRNGRHILVKTSSVRKFAGLD